MQNSIKEMLSKMPSFLKFNEENRLILNCLIKTDELILNSDYWAFPIDGTFYLDDKNVL